MKRLVAICTAAAVVLLLCGSGSASIVTLVDNTPGQTTINNHQLETTGGVSGTFATDVSASTYNLEAGAVGYVLSGRLEIGGMTANNDGDTSWAEVMVTPVSGTWTWDSGVNIEFQGSSTLGTAGYGYDFYLREGKTNLGYFNTSNIVRSNLETETAAAFPRSVFFDFVLTAYPSGPKTGTAYLDVLYAGSVIGSLRGGYASTDLSNAYVYVGLANGETGENEFSFLDYSVGGVEGRLDLSPVPAPPGLLLGVTGVALAAAGTLCRRRTR